MAHDVFISHSNKDKTVADATCALLEERGIRCWIAPRDIRPGDEWGSSIVKGIRGARVMVLIFSSHANVSPQIKCEVERAVNAGTTLIPMRIEDVLPQESLDYFLGTQHWLDAFSPPLEQHLEKLASVIREILEMPAPLSGSPLPVEKSGKGGELPRKEAARTPVATRPSPSLSSSKGWLIGLGFTFVAMVCLGYYYGVALPEKKAALAQDAQAMAAQQNLDNDKADTTADQPAANTDAMEHPATGADHYAIVTTIGTTPDGSPIMRAGVSFDHFEQAAQQRQGLEWCWAASLSNTFAYYGHPLKQEKIVQAIYGRLDNFPDRTPQQIAKVVERDWTDDNGQAFHSSITTTYDAAAHINRFDNHYFINQLSNGRPLLICTSHCMIVGSVDYTPHQLIGVNVQDPAPDSPKSRALLPPELIMVDCGGQCTFIGSLDITD